MKRPSKNLSVTLHVQVKTTNTSDFEKRQIILLISCNPQEPLLFEVLYPC